MCIHDDCANNDLDRRTFLSESAGALSGLAASRLEVVANEQEKRLPATKVLKTPEMRNIETGKVLFRSAGKEIDGYLAHPKAEGKHAAVLILAGNRITEEYIPNTCAAQALAGFVAFTPNNYHAVPDSAKTVAQLNKALEHWTDDDYMRDCLAAVEYLRSSLLVNSDHIGVVGYASRALEKDLRERGKPVELFAYENADHGFLAYTRPQYDEAAANLAWKRTVEFLDKNLKEERP